MHKLSIIAAILLLATSTSSASPEAETTPAEVLVQKKLLSPLKKKDDERSRFSRAAQPPQARRLRVLDAAPLVDANGDAFVRFAVDTRHGRRAKADWKLATITGCAYVDRGEVFVAKGGEFRPAKFLLGKYAKAAGDATCRVTQAQAQAQAAPGA